MNNEITSFKKRNHGEIIYIAISLCLLASSLLLIFQTNISEDHIQIGVRFFYLIIGIGLMLGYYFNKRSAFRPSWTLPLGIILTIISIAFILAYYIKEIKNPSVSLALITIIMSGFTGSLILSTGIQYKSLTLKRRFFYYGFVALFYAYAILGYYNIFDLREDNVFAISAYSLILSISVFFEGVYDLANNYKRKKTVKINENY